MSVQSNSHFAPRGLANGEIFFVSSYSILTCVWSRHIIMELTDSGSRRTLPIHRADAMSEDVGSSVPTAHAEGVADCGDGAAHGAGAGARAGAGAAAGSGGPSVGTSAATQPARADLAPYFDIMRKRGEAPCMAGDALPHDTHSHAHTAAPGAGTAAAGSGKAPLQYIVYDDEAELDAYLAHKKLAQAAAVPPTTSKAPAPAAAAATSPIAVPPPLPPSTLKLVASSVRGIRQLQEQRVLAFRQLEEYVFLPVPRGWNERHVCCCAGASRPCARRRILRVSQP